MDNEVQSILLIDDDDINNFLSKELISLYWPSAQVTDIMYVEEAINFLKKTIYHGQALPDVILVDLNMPILNGWDFVEAFEKFDPIATKNTRIYIYSSSVYYKDIEKSKQYPCVKKFYTKPITQKQVVEIMDNVKNNNP
jgi:CheY-like chemotaxis protein